MEQQTMENSRGGLEPASGARAPIESREQLRQHVQRALERVAGAPGKAAVIVLEVNPNYARRAQERIRRLLQDWRQRHPELVYAGSFGSNRFAFVIAPMAFPRHARSLAERLTRSLDPRICPLLRRALPYAWSGVSLYPDDGSDVETLIAGAEQAMERTRSSGTRCPSHVFSRRRPVGGSVLQPLAAR